MNELVDRAREYEESVRATADQLMADPNFVAPALNRHASALREAAERLVPADWLWRIEETYGGDAIFFITGYHGR